MGGSGIHCFIAGEKEKNYQLLFGPQENIGNMIYSLVQVVGKTNNQIRTQIWFVAHFLTLCLSTEPQL
jgi:hypothetical protein